MARYRGYCPVAKALEVIGERWTLLIVRELLTGSRHFNEMEQGLPGIPRSLLSQRLRALVRAGVVERRAAGGNRVDYSLTRAGQELYDIVVGLGEWGQRWVISDIGASDIDPQLLLWDMHRRLHVDRLPERRVVVQFDFRGACTGAYWLVLERREPSVCLRDPGFEIDLLVTADTVALHRVWTGRLAMADAMHDGLIRVEGASDLVKAFPGWLALNMFAGVAPATAAGPQVMEGV